MALKRFALAATLTGFISTLAFNSANASQCGGEFQQWLDAFKQEAKAEGVGPRGLKELQRARYDKKVIARDRSQGVFAQTFATFSSRMVSADRLRQGKIHLKKYMGTFARAREEYGVPGPVIAAFWALETDFGAVQGNFDTLSALVTLSYDCRRPELFRPQLIGLLKLFDRGDLPERVQGAWAGEVGQIQMLPADILKHGMDGNNDGRVDLRKTKQDVIMTAAKFLHHLGWKADQPWLQEVVITQPIDIEETGRETVQPIENWAAQGVKARTGSLRNDLKGSLVLPMGKGGPAFITYPNFDIYLEWNQSFVYTLTAAYLATRLAGAPKVDLGHPDPGLSIAQMKELQKDLQNRGYDVGKIDGILGRGTRAAVRAEQKKHNLPIDGWPTQQLLNAL